MNEILWTFFLRALLLDSFLSSSSRFISLSKCRGRNDARSEDGAATKTVANFFFGPTKELFKELFN